MIIFNAVLLSFIKKSINSIISSLGYEVINKPLKTQNSFFSLPQIIFEKEYNKKKDKLVIFDVGAHLGESINLFTKIINKFKLQIHSFEPNKENFRKLYVNYKSKENIFLNNFAIGNKNAKKKFFIYSKRGADSFLKINKKSKWYFKRNKPKMIKEIITKVETIDKYTKRNSIKKINLLKIDTQGTDLAVIMGARNALKKNLIDIIDISLIIGDAYKKKYNVYDLEKILIPFRYKLIGVLSDRGTSNILAKSHLELRLLYCKKKIFEKLTSITYQS